MIVVGLNLQQPEWPGHLSAHVSQHARGGRPGPRVARTQHAPEQGLVHPVVLLVHPQRLEQMMLVIPVVLVQTRDPRLRRGDHLPGIAGT